MLKVLKSGENFAEPCALLLGGFDGLHAGHMSLVAAAKSTGLPVGATALCGNKAGGNLFTFAEREYIFEKAGLLFVLEEEFTEEFKRTSAEEYLNSLFSVIRAKAVFCGEDYRFGKDAAGTVELLRKLAPCPVTVLPLFLTGGKKISISDIKRLLQEGDAEDANGLLAYDYFVQGEVERGRQVGRTLGFPTLNLSYPQEKFPIADGVYGGYTETPAGRFSSIINFGSRPTFDVTEKKVEAYLKGFHGDLYGRIVRIYPEFYIRPIVKFSSEEELKIQLKKDIKHL